MSETKLSFIPPILIHGEPPPAASPVRERCPSQDTFGAGGPPTMHNILGNEEADLLSCSRVSHILTLNQKRQHFVLNCLIILRHFHRYFSFCGSTLPEMKTIGCQHQSPLPWSTMPRPAACHNHCHHHHHLRQHHHHHHNHYALYRCQARIQFG